MFREINLPATEGTRKPENPNDFGDILTIGLHLKKKGMRELGNDDDFAVYLGFNEVGIKSLDSRWYVKEKIKYNSLEEMKAIWQLD